MVQNGTGIVDSDIVRLGFKFVWRDVGKFLYRVC